MALAGGVAFLLSPLSWPGGIHALVAGSQGEGADGLCASFLNLGFLVCELCDGTASGAGVRADRGDTVSRQAPWALSSAEPSPGRYRLRLLVSARS